MTSNYEVAQMKSWQWSVANKKASKNAGFFVADE
jgi:hypothetical protein